MSEPEFVELGEFLEAAEKEAAQTRDQFEELRYLRCPPPEGVWGRTLPA
jgi:hypothetical protein